MLRHQSVPRRNPLVASVAGVVTTRRQALGPHTDDRLADKLDSADFQRETEAIIADLRAAGHDLWSHDYDGEGRHLWGWDYMRPSQAGRLQIQFNFRAPCQTFWRA